MPRENLKQEETATPETRLVCSKCGKTTEYHQALKAGWLYAQRQGKPDGYLVIRCPDHVTGHALRLAGLPQKTTSKRIEDNLERGLCCEYGDGYIASAYESEDNDGVVHFVISYHAGEMPAFNANVFDTIPALIQAMRKVQPDLRKWKLARVE